MYWFLISTLDTNNLSQVSNLQEAYALSVKKEERWKFENI